MKTVLITGISRGIGKALAQKFLSEGYFVIGTATKGKTDLKNENFVVFQLDLNDPQSIKVCTQKITALQKPIDILINNAGTWIPQNNYDFIDIKVLRQTLEVNLIGTIDFTNQVIGCLNQGAHVVNVSSRQGSLSFLPGTSNESYKISKAGLNMFTRVFSHQLAGKAIVSSVHPGSVKTDMGSAGANMEPEEAAQYIYELAISRPETGQFWFKGEKFAW